MSTVPPEPEHAPPEYAPHVSIVLPCFNEEEHVLLEIERICIAMDKSGLSYELLAIDDGSTDQTLARLRRTNPTSRTSRPSRSAATAAPAPSAASAPSGPAVTSWSGPTPT